VLEYNAYHFTARLILILSHHINLSINKHLVPPHSSIITTAVLRFRLLLCSSMILHLYHGDRRVKAVSFPSLIPCFVVASAFPIMPCAPSTRLGQQLALLRPE
jgi:hypothetical protein